MRLSYLSVAIGNVRIESRSFEQFKHTLALQKRVDELEKSAEDSANIIKLAKEMLS